MSGRKPCFLTATELAYGVPAKELLAARVTESHLAQLASPKVQDNAVATLPPGGDRGRRWLAARDARRVARGKG